MHISITADLAWVSSPRFSILRSAKIMASGFLVSSTEPESARYSRWRDSAKRITTDNSHGDHDQCNRNDDGDDRAVAAAFAVAAAAAPAAETAVETGLEEQPEHQFAEERDHAGDDHRDHQHAHVAVADMRELVAEHGFHFLIVERVHQPARHRDRILLVVEAGGEGVERVVVGDAQRRHGDAARDAEIFQEIIEPRLFRAGDLRARR